MSLFRTGALVGAVVDAVAPEPDTTRLAGPSGVFAGRPRVMPRAPVLRCLTLPDDLGGACGSGVGWCAGSTVSAGFASERDREGT